MKRKTIQVLTALIVMFLVLNPETIHMALFIDTVGLDLLLMLFEVQIVYLAILIYSITFKPFVTRVSLWLKPRSENLSFLRKEANAWVLAFPDAATIMHLLVLTAALGYTVHGA